MRIDQGSRKCKEIFRKSDFFSEAEDQGRKQKIRDWVGIFERAIVGRRRSGSEMCERRTPGTGWVVGSYQSGSKFEQNRVGGSDQGAT